MAIASAVNSHEHGPVVVIAPDMQAAEILVEQVAFFTAQDALPAITFPDWESLPYDSFSPHQDIISRRLETLYRLCVRRREHWQIFRPRQVE